MPILAPLDKEFALDMDVDAKVSLGNVVMLVLVVGDLTRSDDCHTSITGQTWRLAVRLV
jgi:hypothetical protein